MRPVAALAFALFLQVGSTSVFETDLWPGEGIPVFAAATSKLQLHESPSRSARVTSTMVVSRGLRVEFDETRYITIVPERLTAIVPTVVAGRMFGSIRRLSREDYYSARFAEGNVPVAVGKDIEYLQYRAEGSCFVRVDKEVIEADSCPAQDSEHFRGGGTPVIEWWIHLSGTHVGWIEVTNKTLKQVDREL